MPGINTTGAPETRDYHLGRGILYLATLGSNGLPDANGFRDLGNAPEFNVTLSSEDVRHRNSRDQLAFTDKRCTISQEIGLSFTLDELNNFDNLADLLAGTTGTHDNPHDTTWANHEDSIVSSAVKLGRWYELKDDNGERVYNLDATGCAYSLEEDPASAAVALVEGTDYEIDEKLGLVRFLPTATNVADGETVGFAITTGASSAQDVDEVQALTRGDVVGALLFKSVNACDNGQLLEYLFHKVSLTADGDVALLGDEIATMSFTGVAEANSAITASGDSQVLRVRTYDQAG